MPKQLFYVQEYCAGGSLGDLVRQQMVRPYKPLYRCAEPARGAAARSGLRLARPADRPQPPWRPSRPDPRRSDDDALRWSLAVSRALQYLHETWPVIMHRDLKLDNMCVEWGVLWRGTTVVVVGPKVGTCVQVTFLPGQTNCTVAGSLTRSPPALGTSLCEAC